MKRLLLFIAILTVNHLMAQNVGIGNTNPLAKLSIGPNSEFRVDSVGDIARINNVPYTFPTTQGISGKALVNDGAGNFSWKDASMPIGSIVDCYGADTANFISNGYTIEGLSVITEQLREPAVGNWTPSSSYIYVPSSYYMQSDPTVWDGTEMLVYHNNYVYRWNTAGTTVVQSAVNTVGTFTATSGMSAVWDGTDMIIYGGSYSNKGVKYNPTTNTWAGIANGPVSVSYQSAVWDNVDSVMIIWGGDSTSTINNGFNRFGYKYKPSINSWSAAISSVNAPPIRANALAVWTGTKMLIYGGNYNYTPYVGVPLNDCYEYTPSTNTWVTKASTFTGMANPVGVWTGSNMIVWGTTLSSVTNSNYNFGYQYNEAADTWVSITTQGSNSNNDYRSDVVWDGSSMVVIRGYYAQKYSPIGMGYAVELPTLTTVYIMRKASAN